MCLAFSKTSIGINSLSPSQSTSPHQALPSLLRRIRLQRRASLSVRVSTRNNRHLGSHNQDDDYSPSTSNFNVGIVRRGRIVSRDVQYERRVVGCGVRITRFHSYIVGRYGSAAVVEARFLCVVLAIAGLLWVSTHTSTHSGNQQARTCGYSAMQTTSQY